MRNKVLILFFLGHIFFFNAIAQVRQVEGKYVAILDSVFENPKKERMTRMKKLFQQVAVDSTNNKVEKFAVGFREKYLDDADFEYNEDKGSKTFLSRLMEKLTELLKKLLGLNSFKNVSNISSWVIRIIAVLIVLVALYFIIRLIMSRKRSWVFGKKNDSMPIDINNVEQLIANADFEELIAELEKQGDIRQSIRLYYLWLLKDLKDKQIIKWLPEKTNTDYLSELNDELLRKQFSYLSYLFNYIWYGEFSIADSDYVEARKAFLTFLKGGKWNG